VLSGFMSAYRFSGTTVKQYYATVEGGAMMNTIYSIGYNDIFDCTSDQHDGVPK
jgi:hypothetical protein